MAGGKLTPRQKMINMMYLVLTALLALNISKDILDSLVKLEKGLGQTASTVTKKNDDIYKQFVDAAKENPTKVEEWKNKAFQVKDLSTEMVSYIESIKKEIIVRTGGMILKEEDSIPKGLDNREKVATYMLNEGKGKELQQKIEAFRSKLTDYAKDNEMLKSSILSSFNTDPVKHDNKTLEWDHATFEHYPMIAVMAFLTDYQAKVVNAESEVISYLQQNIGKTDLKFTDVEPVVVPKSTFVTQGDKYEADVFLAAYDATQDPEIFIGDRKLDAEFISNGRGKVILPADGVGERKWAGKISIKQNGEVKYYDVNGSYNVAPPSAVISPSKMNVLYRNLDNPIEIGVPGYDPAKVKVSGPGIRQTGPGQYIADVTNVQGREVEISVAVEGEEGASRPMGKKMFRIKSVPPAEGSMQGQKEVLRSAGFIKNGVLEARLPDFPYELELSVASFEVVVPGFPPSKIQGNKLNNEVKGLIDRTKNGATIVFRNIKATGPKGLRVDASGFSLDVNN